MECLHASKSRCDHCVLKAIDKEWAEQLAADIYGSKLTLLNYILMSLGEQEYETESKYLVELVSPNEQEDGNFLCDLGALDMGESIFDHHKHTLVNGRFAYYLSHKQVLELEQRCWRKRDGVETATLYHCMYVC